MRSCRRSRRSPSRRSPHFCEPHRSRHRNGGHHDQRLRNRAEFDLRSATSAQDLCFHHWASPCRLETGGRVPARWPTPRSILGNGCKPSQRRQVYLVSFHLLGRGLPKPFRPASVSAETGRAGGLARPWLPCPRDLPFLQCKIFMDSPGAMPDHIFGVSEPGRRGVPTSPDLARYLPRSQSDG